jgi:hypothetical protein
MATATRAHVTPLRVVIVVLVAVVAAGAAAGAVLAAARTSYTAQTTVFVTRVVPTSANGDDTVAIDDFETALRLHQVDDAVARQAHVSSAAVRNGVTLGRQGASSAVKLSYASTSPAVATAVVTSAGRAALATLAQQQVDSATEAVAVAQASATKALTALTNLNQSLSADDVEADYARHSQNLIDLQNQAAVSPSAGLTAAIQSEQALVSRLAAAIPTYVQLKAASDSAQATLASADSQLTDATGRLSAAQSTTVLTTPTVTKTSRASLLVRVGLGAAAAAALIAIALFALADAMGRWRTGPERVAGDSAAPAVGTWHSGNGAPVEAARPGRRPAATARAAAASGERTHNGGAPAPGEQLGGEARPVGDRAPG